ncbi:hypothetical protein IIDPJIOB_02488 [Aeromonas veronii]
MIHKRAMSDMALRLSLPDAYDEWSARREEST